MFILYADKNNLKIQEKEMVTSGSVNIYTCRFIFNQDWDNLDKTAVFKYSETTVAVELSPVYDDDSKEYIFETNIPWEVMQEYGRTLYIGVRGAQGETLVLPTIWASVGTIKQGVLSADAGTDIPPNKYDELKADISKKGDALEYNGIDLNLLSDGQIISTVPIVGNTDSGDITTGVLSFNGRTGRVVPEIGDYTAEMVGALPSTTSIPSMPEDIGADPAGAGEVAAEEVKKELLQDLDNKLDTTGGTITGAIQFTENSVSLQRNLNDTNSTIVDSTGIHYNGTGVLQIEENGLSVIDEIKSEIPKRTSQLENDSGYITQEDIPPIPTKISQLENDKNFVDEQYVQEAVSNISSGPVGGSIPSGGIIIWSGTMDTVPDGWHLCDGEEGTPDLRDRFVLGAGTFHAVGETGGEEEVTLTIDQMPSHTHYIQLYGNYSTPTASKPQGINSGFTTVGVGNTGIYPSNVAIGTGGSQSHENMPPYYVLAYIMKL